MIERFQPKDFVAAISILCITIMKLAGYDGYLDGIMGLIVGYYFAHRRSGDDKGI